MRFISAFAFALFAAISEPSHAEWWNPFGPSNYEDCVLQAMKEAKTDEAARVAQSACRSKFAPRGSELVSACHVTWVGSGFVLGRPSDPSEYVQVEFPNTADRAWFPSHMNLKDFYISKYSDQLRLLCPSIQQQIIRKKIISK